MLTSEVLPKMYIKIHLKGHEMSGMSFSFKINWTSGQRLNTPINIVHVIMLTVWLSTHTLTYTVHV